MRNLWPLVGILVVLLIVLPIGTAPPFIHYHRWSWGRLPHVSHPLEQPSALREDRIVSNVPRDGNIFLRDPALAPVELAERIREAVGNCSERKVYLVVEGRTRYGDVKPVLESIRLAGITDVCFITQTDSR